MNRRIRIPYRPTSSFAMLALLLVVLLGSMWWNSSAAQGASYPIVDTGQEVCYDDSNEITCPREGEAFYGQDAQADGNQPSYTDNGDGTVTDNVTGLVWTHSADTDGDGDIDIADKMAYDDAAAYCEALSYAGHDDWHLPTIKQLYSLIDFSGVDPSGYGGTDTSGLIPFVDTDYFDFAYGDTSAGERIIDMQYASSTMYVADTGIPLLFGVNFADGRIKGYGITLRGQDKTFAVACIRQNSTYGVNDFVANGDGTITDNACGLMWAQADSGSDAPAGLNWEEALAYVEGKNGANYLGYSDWRLPNVKELQSIVDYTRSPDTTGSAAIDPLFSATPITNEGGETDYAFYWSSTTHANWTNLSGGAGAYVSFGRGLGYMGSWQDVHGAGSQRSDPKSGDPAAYPTGHGPQGDAIRIYNYVRLVRDTGQNVDLPQVVYLPAINSSGATLRGAATGGEGVETMTAIDAIAADEQPELATNDAATDEPADQSGSMGQPGTGEEQPRVQPPGVRRPDLATAAAQLGVAEEALQAALGDPGQGPPDLAAAAQQLDVTEEVLMAALGLQARGPMMNGLPPARGSARPGTRP